jgi:hypothetical protein
MGGECGEEHYFIARGKGKKFTALKGLKRFALVLLINVG